MTKAYSPFHLHPMECSRMDGHTTHLISHSTVSIHRCARASMYLRNSRSVKSPSMSMRSQADHFHSSPAIVCHVEIMG